MAACTANAPKDVANVQARKLNDSATVIWFKVKGLVYPKDSLQRSILLLQEATHRNANYRLAFHNLLNCLNDAGEHSQSEKVCTEWINRHPNDTDFILKRGILREVMGKKTDAAADYKRVINVIKNEPLPVMDQKLSPEDIQKVIARAYNLIILTRDKAEALQLMEELKNNLPNNLQVASIYENMLHLDRKKYLSGLVNYNN